MTCSANLTCVHAEAAESAMENGTRLIRANAERTGAAGRMRCQAGSGATSTVARRLPMDITVMAVESRQELVAQ